MGILSLIPTDFFLCINLSLSPFTSSSNETPPRTWAVPQCCRAAHSLLSGVLMSPSPKTYPKAAFSPKKNPHYCCSAPLWCWFIIVSSPKFPVSTYLTHFKWAEQLLDKISENKIQNLNLNLLSEIPFEVYNWKKTRTQKKKNPKWHKQTSNQTTKNVGGEIKPFTHFFSQ